LARKEEIIATQAELENTYSTTKAGLKMQKNEVVADIQNKKREILEKSIEESTEGAEAAKEKGEGEAAKEDEAGGEAAGPSVAEQAATAAAKEAAKVACECAKEKGGMTDEEKAAAAEAELATIEKKELEATEAKEKVEGMKEAAVAHIEGTKSKLEENAVSLEAAKKVKGGCPDCKDEEKREDGASGEEEKVEKKDF
jgi:hypothetical protein